MNAGLVPRVAAHLPFAAKRTSRDRPRNCVGLSERDRHAYDHEKQDAEEQDHDGAGARAGA